MRTRLRSSSSGGPALGTTIVVLLLNALLYAQVTQFKSTVRLIRVVATVVDGKARSVPNLTIDDFILEEDDEPQTIAHLLPAAALPISIGVILDTSGSMGPTKIRTAQRAIDSFLSLMNEDDEIFLMTFDSLPRLIVDFTSDRTRLSKALWTVNVKGSTSLYDSLYQGLQRVKHGRHQKKAVLLVTDGEDNTSMTRPDKALRNIREADMLVYSIGIKGTPGVDMSRNSTSMSFHHTSVDMKVLRKFGEVSGGWAEEISESTFGEKMDLVLGRIATELRSQYSIAYYPNRPTGDGRWHNVEMRMKNPNYVVRGRTQYFDEAQAPVAAPTATRYAGRSLADVLDELASRLASLGLKLFFTSVYVKPEMRVASEPTSTDPRKILDEVLEPHGLRAKAGPKGTGTLQVGPSR